MAASSLILRSLRLIKVTQVRTSSSSLSLSAQSHTSARFVVLRSRSFSSQAQLLSTLHSTSVPEEHRTSAKKRAKAVSSWAEAGEAFFSKGDGSLADTEDKFVNGLKQEDNDKEAHLKKKTDRKYSFTDRRANDAHRDAQHGDRFDRNAHYGDRSDRKINSYGKGDSRYDTRSVSERGFKPREVSPYRVKPGGAARWPDTDTQRSRRNYGEHSAKGSSRAKFARVFPVRKDADVERSRVSNYRGSASVEENEDDGDFEVSKNRSFGSTEPSSKASCIPRIRGEIIYGVGPVHAALQVSRREFFCLYVQENMPTDGGNTSKRKDKKLLEWILRNVIDRGIVVKEISKHDLNMLVDNRPHQGLVLDASPLELVQVSELDCPLEEIGNIPVWVALDEVTDPQNFGAILRSAYFLGASGVVVCAKNSAPLSAVVSKASAGALEVMEILACRNMVKFLENSIENGWRVVGAAAVGRGLIPVRDVPRGVPTILVLGGEGKGLRTNIKRACDLLVSIPGVAFKEQRKVPEGSVLSVVADKSVLGEDMKDTTHSVEDDDDEEEMEEGLPPTTKGAGEDFVAVESLNVSVAAGILLHELVNAEPTTECLIPSIASG